MRPQGESKETQLDGIIRLPDGRKVPVVVTIDAHEFDRAGIANPEPLLLRAVEVFGKTEKALSWLNSPNPMFEDKTPYEAAQTDDGRSKVLDVLFDLEQGFPA